MKVRSGLSRASKTFPTLRDVCEVFPTCGSMPTVLSARAWRLSTRSFEKSEQARGKFAHWRRRFRYTGGKPAVCLNGGQSIGGRNRKRTPGPIYWLSPGALLAHRRVRGGESRIKECFQMQVPECARTAAPMRFKRHAMCRPFLKYVSVGLPLADPSIDMPRGKIDAKTWG